MRNLTKMQMRDYSWWGKYRMIDERFSIDQHQPLYHWQCPGLAFDTPDSSSSPLWKMHYPQVAFMTSSNLKWSVARFMHNVYGWPKSQRLYVVWSFQLQRVSRSKKSFRYSTYCTLETEKFHTRLKFSSLTKYRFKPKRQCE